MKKFKIVFYLLLVAVFTSCGKTKQDIVNESIETVVIDVCEYVIMTKGYKGYMAHKGNCKNCH